ncbi:GNAT family N-acetyltransferase [Clostridium estertheticum]|uniref:GNAT family N-acetyltransferase n=1 Tax=Clostridium estertheticum TaxID=238834 RepID=UPI0013E93CD7|nr:GNAT family N-acetyltransferase [Clostridium estertheticum]MBZ9686334.1 GNAT family N-acetyltransferase [Clostridium estertheticum]
MDFIIRPVKIEDAVFINEIRRQDGVRENIMGITSERVTGTEGFISGLTLNDHMLVAEVEEYGVKRVVGVASLSVNKSNRVRHSGSIGLMVNRDYHRMGIGRALMKSLIDIADNWLMLIRIELGAFTDNEKAINLYKSLGFVIEGTKKYAIIRNGKYDNEYLMARYNI